VMPGKPRDFWKYSTLMGNVLNVTINGNHSFDSGVNPINRDEVIIIGPAFLNQLDQAAGAVQDAKELVFHGAQWQSGGYSRSPELNSGAISSYEVIDFLVEMLFDKSQFPSLNQVVIAGHSLGGQAVI